MIIAFCRPCRDSSRKSAGWRVFSVARLVAVAMALGGLWTAPASADDATRQAYYERSMVLVAHERCRLFQPGVQRALQVAALQTRGVLLRAGHEEASVNTIAARARRDANALACTDTDLQTRANRIVHAFERWGRAARLDFPARQHSWRVDRFQHQETGWRLVQDSRVGRSPVRFGLAGTSPSMVRPTVVISFPGRSRPYAARLVMRDARQLSQAHGVADGQALMPPVSGRVMVLASGRDQAAEPLLAEGQRSGEAWVFGEDAMARLVQLDPREPFWIEFLFHDDSIARVPFEVGDVAAAQAFLGLGPV